MAFDIVKYLLGITDYEMIGYLLRNIPSMKEIMARC